jgi:hypothetical protein
MKPAHRRKKNTNDIGHPFRHLGAPSGPAVGNASKGTQMLNEYPNVIIEPFSGGRNSISIVVTTGRRKRTYHDESAFLGIIPHYYIDDGV